MLNKLSLKQYPEIIATYLVNASTVIKNEHTHLSFIHLAALFAILMYLQLLL